MMCHGSSSSTLSPLAPPFTVNRAAPKPNSSPPPHIFENYYDYSQPRPYLNAYPHCQSPDAALTDPFPPTNRETSSARRPYAYFDSPPSASSGPLLPSLSSGGPGFSYKLCSDPVSATNAVETNSYYVHYPSAVHHDNSLSFKESGYGVLSSATVALPLEGGSQSCYVQSLSEPQLFARGKDLGARLSLTVPMGNVGSHFATSLQLGIPVSEGFMACEDATGAWSKNYFEPSVANVYTGTAINSVVRIATNPSSSEANPNIPCFNISGRSVPVPSSLQENTNSCLLDPSYLKGWNPFNQNMSLYDKCCTPVDSSTTNPTVFNPPVTMLATLPACGSSSSLYEVVQNGTQCSCQLFEPLNGSAGQVFVKVKAPTVTLSTGTGKDNDETRKNNPISVESSSATLAIPLSCHSIDENLKDSSEKEIELKLTQLKLPKDSVFAHTADVVGDSVNKSSDVVDQFISAVDSPCWKGASSWHSLFEVVKNMPSPKPSEDNHEFRSVEKPFSPSKRSLVDGSHPPEHGHNDTEKSGLGGCEHGSQTSDGMSSLGNVYEIDNTPKSGTGLNTSAVIASNHEGFLSLKHISEAKINDPVMNVHTPQDVLSYIHSHDKESLSRPSSKGCFPNEVSSILSANMLNQSYSPALDGQMLVKTVHNLLELIISNQCSNAIALKENDCEIIWNLIDNLLGRLKDLSRSSPHCLGMSTGPCKAAVVCSPLVTEVKSSVVGHLDNDPSTVQRGDMMHMNSRSCEENIDRLGLVTRNGEMRLCKDMEMIEEDHHPKALLYKKLWIEAEAALCSVKYELQLARLEIEMEKPKHCMVKDFQILSSASGTKTDGKNQLSPKFNDAIGAKEIPATHPNKGATENTFNRGSCYAALVKNQVGNNEIAEMVEASVKAQLKVLKGRDENVSSLDTNKALRQKLPDPYIIKQAFNDPMFCSVSSRGKFDDCEKQDQLYPADLGYAERNKPLLLNANQFGEVKFKDRSDTKKLGSNPFGEIGSRFNVVDRYNINKGSYKHDMEKLTLPHVGGWFVSNVPAPGSHSSSSDWEHVHG